MKKPYPSSGKKVLIEYIRHTTGSYPYDGVTLHFRDIDNGNDYHAIFNAFIRYTRTTKKNKKESPLPKGKFRVTDNHDFVKTFWIPNHLEKPIRDSKYSEKLYKLKDFNFEAMLDHRPEHDKALLKQTIRIVSNVDVEVVAAKLAPLEIAHEQEANNSRTTHEQPTNNSRTVVANNNSEFNHLECGFEADSSTYENNHVISKEVYKEIRKQVEPLPLSNTVNTIPNEEEHITKIRVQQSPEYKYSAEYAQTETKRIQSQSVDDWISEYDQAEHERIQNLTADEWIDEFAYD